MITDPAGAAFMPYPTWTYPLRAVWNVVQCTLWRLAWKRIPFLRPTLLKAFGATMPLRSLISGSVKIYFPWALRIGADAAISDRVVFYNLGGVRLGDRVVISQDVYLCGGSHDHTRPNYPLIRLPIDIGDDVWIGAGAFVCPGVRIGSGAVIGARAVVTKDVPPWKVVAGNPARVVRDRIMQSNRCDPPP
jgi:putative colanic acid biosynthesis acetyltransferase WcaF